jgi:hypothetical protein
MEGGENLKFWGIYYERNARHPSGLAGLPALQNPTQVAAYVNLSPMIATLLGATLLAGKLSDAFIVGFVAVRGEVLFINQAELR